MTLVCVRLAKQQPPQQHPNHHIRHCSANARPACGHITKVLTPRCTLGFGPTALRELGKARTTYGKPLVILSLEPLPRFKYTLCLCDSPLGSEESGQEGECMVRGPWVHLHSVADSLRNLLVRLADMIRWKGGSWAGSLGASDQCASPNSPHPLWDTALPPGRAARVSHSQGSRNPHRAHHGSLLALLIMLIMFIMDRLLWS